MEEQIAVVIGGDLRQVYAANALAQAAYGVYAYGFEEGLPFEQVRETADLSLLSQAKLALFPLPVSKVEHLESYLAHLPKGCLLFGGNVTEQEQKLAEGFGLHFRDYFQQESLTVANALLTAEGAISLAMEQLPIALWQCRCLIAGYGRIGRALHSRLKAFGAEITVLARDEGQRMWAELEGAQSSDFSALADVLPRQQLIFNTIPQPWLREELALVAADCPVFELASKPYGVDFALAEQLGKEAILSAALPGKYAPKSAGELISKTILSMR